MTDCSVRYNYTKKIRLSRLFYYLSSLIRLFPAVKPGFIISFTSQLITGSIKTVFLKEYNLQFHLLSLLDLLTLKEVVMTPLRVQPFKVKEKTIQYFKKLLLTDNISAKIFTLLTKLRLNYRVYLDWTIMDFSNFCFW